MTIVTNQPHDDDEDDGMTTRERFAARVSAMSNAAAAQMALPTVSIAASWAGVMDAALDAYAEGDPRCRANIRTLLLRLAVQADAARIGF